jgi:hypothetical protein
LGTSYHKIFEQVAIEIGDYETEGRGIAERYSDKVTGKSFARFSGSLFRTATGVRQTMLDMTVFSLGANVLFGRCRSGSLDITTVVDPCEGGGDQFESLAPVGTEYVVNGELQVSTTASLVTLMKGAIASRKLSLVIASTGFGCTLPMKLNNAVHGLQSAKVQTENFTCSSVQGTPSGVTGDPVLVSLITGTALGAVSINAGGNTHTFASATVTQGSMRWNSGAIIMDNFSIQCQGAPT